MNTLIILFFVIGIILQFYDKLLGKDFKFRKILSITIILISIFVFIFLQVHRFITKRQLTKLVQDQEVLSQNQKVMCEDLSNLKIQLNKNYNKISSNRFDGVSFNLFLRIYKDKSYSKKYILDNGEGIYKNRFSIYLDENNDLNFRMIDELKESYKVKVKRSLRTFDFNQLIFLSCEFGQRRDSSFLRILINGNIVAHQILDAHIHTNNILNLRNQVMGANLNFNENASFGICEFILRIVTWSKEDIEAMITYFDNKPNISTISFSEDDFMFIDKKTNGLVQPDQRHKPKFIKVENCFYTK